MHFNERGNASIPTFSCRDVEFVLVSELIQYFRFFIVKNVFLFLSEQADLCLRFPDLQVFAIRNYLYIYIKINPLSILIQFLKCFLISSHDFRYIVCNSVFTRSICLLCCSIGTSMQYYVIVIESKWLVANVVCL